MAHMGFGQSFSQRSVPVSFVQQLQHQPKPFHARDLPEAGFPTLVRLPPAPDEGVDEPFERDRTSHVLVGLVNPGCRGVDGPVAERVRNELLAVDVQECVERIQHQG